ncbi:hypothetical protein B0A55_09702 [Friedmanniomyces simplex]|uniref:Uncharacterized protein n=1 Tax=Friedmanniomyces simplex TaxID=329884 RepID=A0A4V5NER7_9PEZI|nr:hypothetical protein B0A55_09702 [Friedmanniomyces simplex]
MYGRPRSRTAPSTPLVEAPGMEPVELPGSLLAGKSSIMSLHQSIDGSGVFDSLESQKRASQEAAVETEGLKRKLSLAKKAQSESGEVRRERDRLRQDVERGSRRILQLKEIVRKSKDQEKSLRNAVSDLECRLVAANNERTDVLEGFHEASGQLQKLAGRELMLKQEVEDLRSRLSYANGRHASDTALSLSETNALYRPKHCRTKSDVAGLAIGNDPGTQQRELRRVVAVRDARIRQLEQDLEATQDGTLGRSTNANAMTHDRVNELEVFLYDHKKMLSAAREDCERYNSLLHQELRRQSRVAAQTAGSISAPRVDAEAFTEATEKAKSIILSATDSDPATATALLQRELEHCLKEILLYKLDIRGCKKDLKRAQAQLAELKAVSIERPPTPDRESSSSIRSDASSTRKLDDTFGPASPPVHPGLGILLPQQPPQTPTRMLASATSAALLVATPPLPLSPPPPRPKTPMGAYKKLPKPPAARTPSPLPVATLSQRDGTLRSLSESIISSYAQRDTPGMASYTPSLAGTAPDGMRS